jgi:hypothetical protein
LQSSEDTCPTDTLTSSLQNTTHTRKQISEP